MPHLLIVDDEQHFCTTLSRALKSQGYRATILADTDALASALAIHKPDVVLLDVMFNTGTNGLDACRALRNWSSVPVIMISASYDESIKIQALDAGADDFIVKPFSIEELLARVRAIQRRLERVAHNTVSLRKVGELSIDFASSLVMLNNEPLHLTRNEYKLIKALVEAEGKPVSYKSLLAAIYGRDGEINGEKSTIRILVKQLRRKLNEDLSSPRYVLTESGLGYRFNMNPPLINSRIDAAV